jgi:hypothetical protein
VSPFDDLITPEDEQRVRQQAARLLKEAGATGCFPTPVDEIVRAAKLSVAPEGLHPGFLKRLYRGVTEGIKSAVGKVRALLHLSDRLILVDREQPTARWPWLKLHEAGHSFMPWQREMYGVTEDCEHSLEPTVTELFEREANLFAAEVLFQGEQFERDAQDVAFGVMAPVGLSKRYGASIYTCVWRYVATNPRACAVIVLEKKTHDDALGSVWPFRRFIRSPKFAVQFETPDFPKFLTVSDGGLGTMLPKGKQRFVGRREFPWTDRNGEARQVLAEAFHTGHNVFILIFPVAALSKAVIVP